MMKDSLLILASICFLIMIGGATYEHIAVIPAWSAAPPASLTMFQGEYGLAAQYFWMAMHPVTLLLMIISLVLHWRTYRRKPLILVLSGYIVILITTALYFVPVLLSIINTPYSETPDPALISKASLWEILSLVRLLFLFILAYIILLSLTKSNAPVQATTSSTVPLAYPNDSLGG